MAALRRALAATGQGPRAVVVAGEAGIGKSRLLTEFAARARDEGTFVAAGGCLDLAGGGPGFLPFIEALRQFVRGLPTSTRDELLGPPGNELSALIPDLLSDRSTRPPPARPEGVDQGRLFEVVLALVARLAAERPLVIAIEDIHWIDRSSRDLLTFLVRNLDRDRVLFVLTWRSDYLDRGADNAIWLAELLRLPTVERLDLDRLDRAAVGAMVEAIRGPGADRDLVDETWRRSDGNPFFVEELLVSPDVHAAAPPSLREVLEVRLAALSAAARAVLGPLAVAGRPVDDELLSEVVEGGAGDVRAGLREGLARYLLELDESSSAVRFRHALLREVVAADLLPGERRGIHERLARTLERRIRAGAEGAGGAGILADLARHWDGAGRAAEAYSATLEAARAAARVAAHGHAHTLYERAVELSAEGPAQNDPVERLTLLREAADEADLSGEAGRAIELVREAIDVAQAQRDGTTEGVLRDRLGYLLWREGDPVAGLTEHETAASLVPADPPTEARARVLAGLGGAYFSLGRYAEAREASTVAVAAAMRVGARQEEARARNMLGSSLVALGEVESGLAELETSRGIVVDVGPPETLVGAHYNLALNLAEAGRIEDALAEAMAARATAHAAGLDRRFGMDLAALVGDALIRLGRWDEADVVLAEGLTLDPGGRGSVFLAMVRGRLDALRGDITAAADRFEGLPDSAGALDADVAAYLARGRAELALAAGDPEAALSVVEQLERELGDTDEPFARPAWVLGLRAVADLAAGRSRRRERGPGELPAAVDRLRARLVRGLGQPAPPGSAWIALGEAEVARMAGHDPPDVWQSAAERFDVLHDPYHVAYARLRQAEAGLRRDGLRSAASQLLFGAHASLVRLGASPLTAEVEALARRARIDLSVHAATPSAPSPSGGGGESVHRKDEASRAGRSSRLPTRPVLSSREIEVVRLIAEGRSNGEIAELLFISRKTASVHVSHILDKLDASNRVEAAMNAARMGLLQTSERDD